MRVRRIGMCGPSSDEASTLVHSDPMRDWRENLIDSEAELAAVLADTKRIAVLGIKTEAQAVQPAFYVPRYMAEAGYEIVPVPVYYPDVVEILGVPVYRRLANVPP